MTKIFFLKIIFHNVIKVKTNLISFNCFSEYITGLLVACKNEEDPIKNEGARVVTTLFINFSDPQG